MPAKPRSETVCLIGVEDSESHCVTTYFVSSRGDSTWTDVVDAAAQIGHQLPTTGFVGEDRIDAASPLGTYPLVSGVTVRKSAERPTAGLVHLEAIEGPDCGSRIVLGPRPELIGRARSHSPRLRDPYLSRHHCEVVLDAGRVSVTSLSTTSPALINGAPVESAPLSGSQRLCVGSSTYVVRTVSPPSRDTTVDPTPRHTPAPPQVRLDVPRAPVPRSRRRFPLLLLLLPACAGLALATLLHNRMFLLFAFFGPVMMLAGVLSDRSGSRRQFADERQAWQQATIRLENDVHEQLTQELAMRRRRDPSVAECREVVDRRQPGLWGRTTEDGLRWRIGIGTVDSCLEVDGVRPRITGAPVALTLRSTEVIGIFGVGEIADALADSLVLQCSTWHSPRKLTISYDPLAGASRPLPEWAGLLPHVRGGIGTGRVTGEQGPGDPSPVSRLIVVRSTAPGAVSTSALIADRAAGSAVVILASTAADLPAECTRLIECTSESEVIVHDSDGSLRVTPDLPTEELAWLLARRIAPLRDGSGAAIGLAERVDLPDVIHDVRGTDITDPVAVQSGWGDNSRSPHALMGMASDGPWEIDLCSDGPHVLVAGTTGAGKSELLRTLIVSLAVDQPPDRLHFVLIDYKGGAAFQACADLPHTAGVVTDLDEHLTRRALTALEAELRRRERTLSTLGAKDIDDFTGRGGSLARLVLVVDEFRFLAEELPDFVSGLVRIATVGRSLGIHLVLATQRPSGIVSADIRANVGLRIALRVRDEGDSQDVVGCRDAATLPASSPGRAVVRSADGPPLIAQCALTGGPGRGTSPVRVHLWDSTTARPVAHADTGDGEGLADLVNVIRQAGSRAGLPTRAASPWPDPLPARLTLAADSPTDGVISGAGRRCLSGMPTVEPPFALVDLPAQQCVDELAWEPAQDDHLAITGATRSGRTTALLALVRLCCTGRDVYVVDMSGRLQPVESLPGVGAVIDRDEPSRLRELVAWLTDEIRTRTAASTANAREVIVAVDGWDTFVERSDDLSGGAVVEEFAQAMRDGAAVGVFVVATGGRGLLSGRAATNFSSRITLRLTDTTELLLAGLRSDSLSPNAPPGRGLILPSGEELQVARDITAATRVVGQPHRIPRLPDDASVAHLSWAIGMTGDSEPLGWPDQRGRLAGLIAGPPRSGRTTALLAVARTFSGHAAIVSFDPPRGPTPIPPDQPAQLAEWSLAHPSGLLLLDDLDRMTTGPVDEIAARYLASGGSVLGSGDAAALGTGFRGVAADLRRSGTGILLRPGRRDGDLFGVRCGPVDRPRPGRGVLVHRGAVTPIQIAAPTQAPT